MEHIVNSLDLSSNINIIGDNEQILQKVLKKYDSVTVNANYISYVSSSNLEEIPYNDQNSFYSKNITADDNQCILKNQNFLRLKNNEDNFEYIGLYKQGKIIKISPLLYNDLFVRVDTILAFSDGVDLIEDKSQQKKLNTHFNPPMNIGFSIIKPMNNSFCLIKGKYDKSSSQFRSNNEEDVKEGVLALMKDYVYLSCGGGLVEKRLGENEQIVIMKNGLIAFEKSVSFYKMSANQNQTPNKHVNYINSIEDIIVEGPGLVMFHTCDRMNKTVHKGMFKSLVVTFVIMAFIELITRIVIRFPIE